MALNNVWEDKQDGIDDILSKDINDIAHAVIEDEKDIEAISESLTQKADSVTAEGEIVRQDTPFTAGGVSANLDEWVQTASAADSKAQDNAHEIEGLKEGKAEKGILENIDIRSVSESGIYTVGYNCDGYPGDVVVSDYSSGAETLIVSKNQDTELKMCAQYLILSKPFPSTSKIYFARFIKSENGDIVADIPWTLIYDTSKPQLMLDATLSKDGTAADSKAVGDALLEKADKVNIEYMGMHDWDVFLAEMLTKTELRINDLFTGEITIILPEEIADDYISSIVFESSSPARTLIYPASIQITGTDCIEGVFVPKKNKRYTLYLEYDGKYVNGFVSGVSTV